MRSLHQLVKHEVETMGAAWNIDEEEYQQDIREVLGVIEATQSQSKLVAQAAETRRARVSATSAPEQVWPKPINDPADW